MLLLEASRAKVEAAIEAAKTRTDAEIVVALAPRSGAYADADRLAGAVLAALALTALLAGHFHGRSVPEEWIPPLTFVSYVVGSLLASRVDGVRSIFVRGARRSRQVREAARIAFVAERVGATRGRDGLLLYVSAFEGEVLIVPDLGVEGKVESAAWPAIAREIEETATGAGLEAALLRAIERIAERLAKALPKTASDSPELARDVRLLSGGIDGGRAPRTWELAPEDLTRIETAVGQAEAKTDAEIVVALARSSGSYRDVDLFVGAVVAAAALAFIVYSPHFSVRHGLVLPLAAIAWLLGQGLSGRGPLGRLVRRLIAGQERVLEQGLAAARLAFFEESVAATARRTGVLLYVSREGPPEWGPSVVVVVDIGLDGKLSGEALRPLVERIGRSHGKLVVETIVQGIGELGGLLAPILPKTPGDSDELSNRPRLR